MESGASVIAQPQRTNRDQPRVCVSVACLGLRLIGYSATQALRCAGYSMDSAALFFGGCHCPR